MFIETMVWYAYTIFSAWISRRKDAFFSNTMGPINKRIAETKGKKFKTVEEQMQFVRDRANTGHDFINMVLGMASYFLIFILLIYPRIEELQSGMMIALAFAFFFALLSAKYIHPKETFQFQFVTGFLNYTYSSMLLIYLKFFDTIHPILFIVSSILLMYLYGYLEAKYGSDNKNRKANPA